MSVPLVGTLYFGYCGGYFGRDSYGPKRVEAVGADWIVVREESWDGRQRPNFVSFDSTEDMLRITAEWPRTDMGATHE